MIKKRKEKNLKFDFFESIKNTKDEDKFLNSMLDGIDELKDKINDRLEEIDSSKNNKLDKGELYYVYVYEPPRVYIGNQEDDILKLLEGVSDEFIKNLAEGFVLRYKDGKFSVDEELTRKSMNFEFDFDNYKE